MCTVNAQTINVKLFIMISPNDRSGEGARLR